MRAFLFFAGALALLTCAADVRAQWPGEVRGDVVDALSGRSVPVADVELAPAPRSVTTDAHGRFRIRGVEAGAYTLRVRAVGYAPLARDVRVENGTVTDVALALTPAPVALEGVHASVDRARGGGVLALDLSEVRALAVSTAGDVAATLPGVRIEERGRGSSQVPSIRGSGGDAVLVLVDGVPLNDPLTGEADLSTVPAAAISSLQVLPGGRSARYGARAEGGVILIRTAGGEGAPGWSGSAGIGSLGERSLDVAADQPLPIGSLRAGAALGRLGGGFDFEIPAEAGGGSSTRENAHVRSGSVRAAWAGRTDRARLRLGVSAERLERGLPGRSFAPSRTSEQHLGRVRAFGSADGATRGGTTFAASTYWTSQRVDHADPAPPFGDPFDDRTRLAAAGAELHGTMPLREGQTFGGGLSGSWLRVRSTQVADTPTDLDRTDAGGWVSVSTEGPAGTTWTATVRTDRSGLPSRWYVSHDVGVVWSAGRLTARAGHRSSFSPPTLGDQFFREGVGVRANPDLEAERVPSEWLAGLGLEADVGPWRVDVDGEAYAGDIEGMIVWLPDFRFVWSPRNQDVRRRGIDLRMGAALPGRGLDLRVHASWNRTTYRRASAPDVQVVYRPELSGGALALWTGSGWSISAATRYTGARYPVANRVNELPGFWATDVALTRGLNVGGATAELRLEVQRVFDHEDSLIFAYPDPGRTARVLVRFLP